MKQAAHKNSHPFINTTLVPINRKKDDMQQADTKHWENKTKEPSEILLQN